ncbi:MAG: hypothetical protein A2X49_06155 [Lentisphaerae bacterium GWF2_52_8]|nr:MAG: hypothetical protein A2X49_06155 [Lentisphaerae bacterium GWF2_52_8]
MAKQKKNDVVSFKADGPLLKALSAMPNRSEFIRAAIFNALDNCCPLCKGTGLFSPEQQQHWREFQESHSIEECNDCRAVHIVCAKQKANPVHKH